MNGMLVDGSKDGETKVSLRVNSFLISGSLFKTSMDMVTASQTFSLSHRVSPSSWNAN